MIVHLGLTFNGPVLPAPPPAAGVAYLDFYGFLRWLEGHYGLAHPQVNRTALRTEQYRQSIQTYLESSGAPAGGGVFTASFRADATATAEELLARRDELLEAGLDLARPAGPETPERIAVLHHLERLILDGTNDLDLMAGRADRLRRLLAELPARRHPRLRIHLNEPRELLPIGVRRLLKRLETGGDTVHPAPEAPTPDPTTDLGRWQSNLLATFRGERTGANQAVTADGTLTVLRAQRETHLAAFLARQLRDNPDWRPGLLMTVRNQTLDTAIRMEGLPSLGISSTSLARPSLQVLKLVTTFLWDPIEVERVMEFVSLAVKPLDRRLGQSIAEFLADRPGLYSAGWFGMLERTYEEIERRGGARGAARRRLAEEQYRRWFGRSRYPRSGRVPKAEVRGIFAFLFNWAREEYDNDPEVTGLLVLAAQSERAIELLDARPEEELGFLDVERLVRTVYEPAPTNPHPPGQGAPETAFATAAIVAPINQLVWWDFVDREADYFFSKYYAEELAHLSQVDVIPDGPTRRNQLKLWQQLRPVLMTTGNLLLCLPERVDGVAQEPHALLGDLEACFDGDQFVKIVWDIDRTESVFPPLAARTPPDFSPVPLSPLSAPEPMIELDAGGLIEPREQETPTGLEDLLHYPYKWFFRHRLELRGSSILSIAGENRLRGNLSHLFVELLLNDMKISDRYWERGEVYAWVTDRADELLAKHGALLLEYGQEPERVQFVRTIQRSAWTLINHLRQNDWRVLETERVVTGELGQTNPQDVHGRADLVLERERGGRYELALVDLKWRGKTVFRDLIRNAGDLQLCLYSEFLRQHPELKPAAIHTAYYVLRDGLLLARNALAFEGAEVVPAADDYQEVQRATYRKVVNTYAWRWEQLDGGRIEVRCRDTVGQLEDRYGAAFPWEEYVELKEEDARFDDYRVLIGLVR